MLYFGWGMIRLSQDRDRHLDNIDAPEGLRTPCNLEKHGVYHVHDRRIQAPPALGGGGR